MFGLAALSLLTFITPAEAFGRCRHRQQCASVCAPIVYFQPVCSSCPFAFSNYATTYTCMYCDGVLWQQAAPDQTCVMLPSTMLHTKCSDGYGKTSKVPGAKRVLKGCGAYWDPTARVWTWYSSEKSDAYCDFSTIHHSGNVILIENKGFCDNGLPYYDIYVSD